MRDTKLIRRTLIRYGTTQCKPSNRPEGLFYPLAFYGLFTCCTSYRTGQRDFHPLAFYGLLHELPNRPKGLSPSGTFTACSIAKHRIGQTDFHPLILDGSTICNQLGLGGDQGFGRRLIYTPRWFDLQAS